MTRKLFVAAVLLALPAAAWAGDFQKSLKHQWLGAWVVVTSESYSDCGGMYTNNRINGNLVKSSGSRSFPSGELAKLDKVDLHKAKLDLLLTLAEPVLLPYQDGPFTLYREARCKIELEVVLPRNVVKSKDSAAIERALKQVLERHATEQDAVASDSWNGREREPFPDDYELTLARHAVWKAEQTNATVQVKLDQALEETTRLADRIDDDPLYLTGFAQGVEAARGVDLDSCSKMLGVDLREVRRKASRAKSKEEGLAAEAKQGYGDGKVFVYGLEMMHNLPDCFVDVPEMPAEELARH